MVKKIKSWNGSQWSELRGGIPELKAWNGSSWVSAANRVKAWNGSSWTTIWQRSDPQTYTIWPDWTQTYKSNGSQFLMAALGVQNNDVAQGYWNVTGGSSGQANHVTGIIQFRDLRAHLLERPVIKSAKLRLTNRVNYGGTGADLGVRLGVRGTTATSAPSTFSPTTEMQGEQFASSLWVGTSGEGATREINLNSNMLRALENTSLNRQAISLTRYNAADSEAERRVYRGVWHGVGAGTNEQPRLVVTLDYV